MPTTTLPLCPKCSRPITDTAPASCPQPEKHGALVAPELTVRSREQWQMLDGVEGALALFAMIRPEPPS